MGVQVSQRYSVKKYNTDGNQGEIVTGLRQIGARVANTAMVGDGFPDIVVGFRGRIHLMEIKDPVQKPSARKLTGAEAIFHKDWEGLPVHIIETLESAIEIITK